MITTPILPVSTDPAPIPRILHQVWVGSSVPTWVSELWQGWEDHLGPDWTYLRWTDQNRAQWPLSQRTEPYCKHPVVLSDFIRMEQVYKHGGVYMDSDTVPLGSLDPFVGDRPAWVAGGGWYQPEDHDRDLNNAIFGMPPRHPLIVDIWNHAFRKMQSISNPYYIAGPRVWRTFVAEHPDVEIPPWDRFPDLPRKYRKPGMDFSAEKLRPLVPKAAVAVHLAFKSWHGNNTVLAQTPTFIMAIPWHEQRAERARDLAVQTGGKIIWDRNHDAFDTWRLVLKAVGDGPGIIVEDDVILVEDWRSRIEAVISYHADDIIQFFSMRGADLTVGSRYEPGRTFMMNQCYYLPAGVAKALLDFTADWVEKNPEHKTGYDTAMAAWMKREKLKYWLSVPSLAQHEPWRSEINPRRPRNRQSQTFGRSE